MYAVYTYGAAAVEVEVNAETGEVKVLSAAVSDQCGKAINILGIEGQIEGGFALKEEYITGKTKGFKQYHLTRAREVPEISKYLVEVPQRLGPRGAIGMGESPQFPIAPAIISAIHDACGIWINELPAHPERVLKYLNADSNKRTCT